VSGLASIAHSCNQDKERYGDECGIGLIQRDNQSIRPHVHKAMKYLVKGGQCLRLKPAGAHCLRKGGGLLVVLVGAAC